MSSLGDCPNCGTPRQEDASFCEVCGLDWETGKLPEPPAPVGAAEAPPAGWVAKLTPDRSWYDRNEAESGSAVGFPEGVVSREVELVGATVTIGRRDERSGWYPDIDLGHPVDDLGASRRHAELRWNGEGWQLVDTGSTNGTQCNGTPLVADEPVDVGTGDEIHLGAFTRIELEAPEPST